MATPAVTSGVVLPSYLSRLPTDGNNPRVGTVPGGPVRRKKSAASAKDDSTRCLLVVNVQNDHFEGGSFPIPQAEFVVPVINSMRARDWDLVVFIKTEHPANHSTFCSNNPVRAACVSCHGWYLMQRVWRVLCQHVLSSLCCLCTHFSHFFIATRFAC